MSRGKPYGKFSGDRSSSYYASPETAEIVNLAVQLGRPLLIEGEPGCGKTRLATAVAEELGMADQLIATTVKSYSQAKDLLYRFDALRRLQDAQSPSNLEARAVYPYLELEPLGRAIQRGEPCVVLIDEIDKADIDLPNDLLDVLDSFEFELSELPSSEEQLCREQRGFGRRVRAESGGVRPVVLITSNREKQLPEPFLRRCLYVQLEFPTDRDALVTIVRKNLGLELDALADELIGSVVERFLALRERGRELNMQKLPATSELLDWVRALHFQGRTAEALSIDALRASDQAVLFKLRHDLQRYRTSASEPSA